MVVFFLAHVIQFVGAVVRMDLIQIVERPVVEVEAGKGCYPRILTD
jgi:hypothetical protein